MAGSKHQHERASKRGIPQNRFQALGRKIETESWRNSKSQLKTSSPPPISLEKRIFADFLQKSQKTGEVSKRLPTTFAHHETPPKTRSKSKFPISLNPPAQSKLYAEVELMISATANWYLMTQAHAGRMSTDSLTKINSFWTSKNRPQVVEFQFDQLTQHELVQANLKTFRFYGAQAENIITLNAMMISWRTMAKEMSVRTFCTPDSVIRKQLHDCYKILEMLGAPVVTFLAFQEIQVRALATMREQQERREKLAEGKFGFEALEGGRRWEVFPAASEPAVVVAAEGVLGGLLENPFD